MDLRYRLVGYLGALLIGLLLVATAINLHSLRSDVNTELAASEQLALILFEAGRLDHDLSPAEATTQLQRILNERPLRHLTLSFGDIPPPETSPATRQLVHLLGLESASTASHQLQIGDRMLKIAPNPASEIEERLADTVRLCITLLLFSGATLLVAWWSAHRALSPVRELEAGLQRLASGKTVAALPAFALREFKQVAGAIDHLATALSTSRAAQRQLSRQLIQVQEDERRTLARELHDELGQTLTAISVTAAYLERNAGQLAPPQIGECGHDLRRDVRTCGEQLRAMLKRLRPHGLDAEGLASGLRELVDSWQQRASTIDFQLDMPTTLPTLGEEAGLVLYRVVQEALTNAVRHSAAQHCRVSIEWVAAELRLQVEDDGKGLPLERPRRGGLLGMAERLEMIGGSLLLEAGRNNGLRLQISLPLGAIGKQEEQ